MALQCLGGTASRGAILGEIPSCLPPARYAPMLQKSPFGVATPVVNEPAAPPFAANLYVIGIAKIGGQDFVSIAERNQQNRFSLAAGECSKDGIELVRVDWMEEVGKSKVSIKKGAEVAVLEFDQATLLSTNGLGASSIPPGPNAHDKSIIRRGLPPVAQTNGQQIPGLQGNPSLPGGRQVASGGNAPATYPGQQIVQSGNPAQGYGQQANTQTSSAQQISQSGGNAALSSSGQQSGSGNIQSTPAPQTSQTGNTTQNAGQQAGSQTQPGSRGHIIIVPPMHQYWVPN